MSREQQQENSYSETQSRSQGYSERRIEYEGVVYKCPHCGAALESFMVRCPMCGQEIRGKQAVSSVKELDIRLQQIEANRIYEKTPKGIIKSQLAKQEISKVDEQKISLIQNFAVPNTREDILEFMIMATSNVNPRVYAGGPFSHGENISESQRALNDAWLSKVSQIYDKAQNMYGDERDFKRIQDLYDGCSSKIKREKKKTVFRWIWPYAMLLIILIIVLVADAFSDAILAPRAQKNEIARLEAIEQEAQEALENKEYKKALLDAETLIYSPNVRNSNSDNIEQQWDIKRELLIDEIVEAAAEDGVILEYPDEGGDSEDSDDSENFSLSDYLLDYMEEK